jgi:nucleoside-diphosphate-sugar epimerase
VKVLVTGGAGYMGSVLCHLLLAQGHQVRVLDSLMQGGQGLLGLYEEPNFEFVLGDVRSADVVDSALSDIDSVVHLAAIVGDPACARDPELAREVNLDASLQLWELSQRHEVARFVFASTCSNYGKIADPRTPVVEESELRPLSLYAETKVAVERALQDTSTPNGPSPTILRFATLFGLSPRMRFDLTVNEFTVDLLLKRKLEVYGEQFWRPYVHVRDAARAIGMVLEAPAEKVRDQVFNVGDNGENFQKGQLVDLIQNHIKDQLEIIYVQKEEDPRDYRVSFDKISSQLGYAITQTVDDGIRQLIEAIDLGVVTDCDSPRYRN